MAIITANQNQVGKAVGQNIALSVGEFSDLIITELMARFYQQTYRGNKYSTGMQSTSIANATFTATTGLSSTLATAATATPIVGLWNPLSSSVNAVILQAIVSMVNTALVNTSPGSLVWAFYTAQNAISVANQATPVNRKTGLATGSVCKGLSGLALTGLSNVGVFLSAAGIGSGHSTLGNTETQAGFTTAGPADVCENVDGSIIVPPGGVLALFGTTTPVAYSAASGLVWDEIPI
jgi:hypothetical protein